MPIGIVEVEGAGAACPHFVVVHVYVLLLYSFKQYLVLSGGRYKGDVLLAFGVVRRRRLLGA